ncbi:MAG: hypothetical protein KJ025_07825 [Burkholderiales bacterium]|nr:hypothetical protein [Burkholderiales bacterium]
MRRASLLIAALLAATPAAAESARTESATALGHSAFDQDNGRLGSCQVSPTTAHPAAALIALHRAVAGHGPADAGVR